MSIAKFLPGSDSSSPPPATTSSTDIFERLENAIDSTERAAYILEGIVIKNA